MEHNGNILTDLNSVKKGDTILFSYSGTPKTLKLPPGTYICECFGSASTNMSEDFGKGGSAKGTLTLTEPLSLSFLCGGNTELFNGSARDGRGLYSGGATDIRLSSSVWDNPQSLASRIMVAGGAGSSGASSRYGGKGGGLEGTISSASSFGSGGGYGTQTGCSDGANAGTFGKGGTGIASNGGYGGAGGGGYYGGGGVTPDSSGNDDKGGGGGSGFISGHTGCNAIQSATVFTHTGQTKHYSNIVFTETSMTTGTHASTGSIQISVINIKHLGSVFVKKDNIWIKAQDITVKV